MAIKYLYHHPTGPEHGLEPKLKIEPALQPSFEATWETSLKSGLELILSEQDGRNYPWHVHLQHCVINLLLEGEASLGLASNLITPQKQLQISPASCAGGKQNKFPATFLKLCKGQYFIIPAGQKHCLCLAPFSQLVSICLPVEKSKNECLNDFDLACQTLNLPASLAASLQKVRQKIKTAIAAQNWGQIQQTPAKQAQHLLGEHTPSELNLKTMAKLAGYSPWHFLRIFHKQTGLTPHEYLLARKLNLARRLLREKPGELAKTAQAAGFYDQSHMHKLFKQQHGLTPHEFQKASHELAPKT